MKIKKLIYVLVGTLVVASSCSDTEFGNGKEGTPTSESHRCSPFSTVCPVRTAPVPGSCLR